MTKWLNVQKLQDFCLEEIDVDFLNTVCFYLVGKKICFFEIACLLQAESGGIFFFYNFSSLFF